MSKKLNLLSCEDCQKLSLKQIQEMYTNFINPALSTSLKSFSFGNEIVERAKNGRFKSDKNK